MSEIYTTGTWTPKDGEEEAFPAAWREFAGWASRAAGAGTLRLARDVRDQRRFMSFGRWDSIEAVRGAVAAPGQAP